MPALVPCPSCRRHVRVAESACPFCRSALPSTLANSAVPAATQRLTRAAAFAFTATLALTGCSDTTTPTDATPADVTTDNATPTDNNTPTDNATPTDNNVPTDRPTPTDTSFVDMLDTGGPVAAYGGPPDAGRFDSGPDDASIGPIYGAPVDASVEDSNSATDTGGGGVRYGAPPPGDGGGVVPLYGALPPPDAS